MEDRCVVDILKESKICTIFQVTPRANKLKQVVRKVRLPSSFQDEKTIQLALKESSPESKLRRHDLVGFLSQYNGREILDREFATVPGGFQNFLDNNFCVSDDRLESAYQSTDEQDFVHKARIQGVVLRTSKRYVSLITLDGSEELLLKVNPGFLGVGMKIKIGDVIDVVSRHGLDPELVCCYTVNPEEVDTYLDELEQQDDPCTILESFSRSVAVWKYVLNESIKEKEQALERCRKILAVCKKISNISSPSPMPGTIRNFWTSFEGSTFFNDVLPNLVKAVAVDLVTNFIENLLKHVPECGTRAYAIVGNLKIEEDGVEFLKKLISILVVNVAGVKDNIEHLQWNQQPVIPVPSELLTTEPYLKNPPRVKVGFSEKEPNCAYLSEEEYFMIYYTLMREECFHKLKHGINQFLQNGTFDPKDIMMYRVHLLKVDPNSKKSIHEGLSLVFEFKSKKNDESDDPDNNNWLMFGNLLCLSFDATFKVPVWGIVIETESTKDSKTHVHVSLCSERNKLSDAEVITKLQQLDEKGFLAYMVESNTFYRAYGPPMEVLQQKETVPFKEQLVEVKKCTNQPAEYLKNLKKHPDWNIIFDNPSCIELHVDGDYRYELLIKEFMELRGKPESRPRLDDKQLDAIEQALRNKVTLIQGPPGTGKSYVGEALLELLLSMEVPDNNGPILVVTYKNHALDNFLDTSIRRISDFSDKVVRVGKVGENVSEELKERNIYQIKRCLPWDDVDRTTKQLQLQLEAMKPEIDKCVKSLGYCNKFTLSTFIKEADEKHLKSLSDKPDFVNRMNEIMKDKNFQVKHFKELSQLIEGPLKDWLPNEKTFEEFAGKVTKTDQSCVEDIGDVKEESNDESKDESKDESCNTRQSQRSEVLEDRRADEDQGEDDDSQPVQSPCAQTGSDPEETTLIVLPEIPDEKLGNMRAILNAGNIQELKISERIQMVYALQRQRYKQATKEFMRLTNDFTQKQQRRKELCDQQHIKILKNHSVIGMTVSGAAIRASWLECIKPSVVIVEEAAEILESQLVAVIPSSVQHLIMIGDHQQLRPQVHYNVLCRKCKFDVSMFERLIKGGLDFIRLNKQGRMRDEIAQLVRELGIYKEYETREEVVQRNHDVLGCLTKTMFFYDHTSEEKTQKGSHSMYNEHEADEVIKLANYLVCENSVGIERITILCSYRGQVECFERKLAEEEGLPGIAVTTIDSFQGKENDIILLSLVRSKMDIKNAKIGYLSSKNRICVAVSRARIGLYMFGNAHLLENKSSKAWKKIIGWMRNKKCVGKSIDILKKGTNATDGTSPSPAASQSGNNCDRVTNNYYNIRVNHNEGVLIFGDNPTVTTNVQGESTSPQGDGRPRQQSTAPSTSAQNEEIKKMQSVEETSKSEASSRANEGQSQEPDKIQSVEETSKRLDESSSASNIPSAEELEPQEMSWREDIDPHPSAAAGAEGTPLQETGESKEGRPVQDTYLPKTEQGVQEEDKAQPVEESSDGKGQLVLASPSGMPASSGDTKNSGENEVASPQK